MGHVRRAGIRISVLQTFGANRQTCAVPPSTKSSAPATNVAAGDARNSTTSATSRGWPSRPSERLLYREKHAFHVSFESSVELVFRHGCERQAAASVGVRENDVKLSRGLLDVGKQTIEMSEFAGVGLYRYGVMPYFAFRHFKFFLSSPGDKHARAFLGEPLSSRQADSSRTASHENIPRGK
jgi:hypothetical protein